MIGEYCHTIDAKGRLFVPAKLKEELGDTFYVTAGLDYCLSFYTQESWQRMTDYYKSLPLSQAKELRIFFANAEKCVPDKQGRFLLPQKLRNYARLKQNVTFIGMGDRGEIWDTDAYAAMEEKELSPEKILKAMEDLGL